MVASILLCTLATVSLFATALADNQKINATKLDCGMRKLALQFATKISPDPSQLNHVFDALRLKDLCGSNFDGTSETSTQQRRQLSIENRFQATYCRDGACVFVSPPMNQKEFQDGSIQHPWTSIHDALSHTRSLEVDSPTLVLRDGEHSLGAKTVKLGRQDSGLKIIGFPGESVWISGGVGIDAAFDELSDGVFVANLETTLAPFDSIPSIVSLFTTSRRYTRARYPNADPEVDQWGYASKHRLNYSIPADYVLEWHRPEPTAPPNVTLVDLSTNPPAGIPIKNNSAQEGYNWYTSGHGGSCSEVWGPNADSYWCSDSCQGGWAEVDAECAATGSQQIPNGLTYNTSSILNRFQNVSIAGGIIHAWHSQSWAMHMFRVVNQTSKGELKFEKGGGRQGARNWCRCDQCTYAAHWCGQNQKPPWNDTRMISGTWMIENLLSELDVPGEYFFDNKEKLLYVKPNATVDLKDFRLGMLETFIDIRNTHDIVIENIGFRDMIPTYMEEWSPPSGGDWSLHRGGAVFMQNVSSIGVHNCTFRRLDGNAVFLSGRTRNVTIGENRFEWLGESAIATWGDTDKFDATAENFPMYTTIERNIFRELGIYQKQSSAVGHCKAAFTTIRENIMFNTPRAAINFNDMVGGGEIVERNLIFNSCRESGDHGPINTWDRQPFLTTFRDGVTPSFDPVPRTIRNNFIFANYGASQGVDNDDGSSWHHIHNNVWYASQGFKMDYGGHDSVYEDNLVLSYPYDAQDCFDFAPFLEDHGHIARRNRCLVGLGHKMDSGCGDPSCAVPFPETKDTNELVGTFYSSCGDKTLQLESNKYYTPDGIANIRFDDALYSLQEVQEKCGLENGSTSEKLPNEETMIGWAGEVLGMSNIGSMLDVE